MWAFFLAGMGRWIVGGIAGLAIVGGIYAKGRIDATAACVAKQAAQMQKMEKYVRDIRSRIEQKLPLDDSILRSDPFERQDN